MMAQQLDPDSYTYSNRDSQSDSDVEDIASSSTDTALSSQPPSKRRCPSKAIFNPMWKEGYLMWPDKSRSL